MVYGKVLEGFRFLVFFALRMKVGLNGGFVDRIREVWEKEEFGELFVVFGLVLLSM